MTQDLKTSLEELADAEFAGAPVSTVDIGRARADGRRRMIAARVAPVGGAVAVVAACALVVNGLGGALPAKPGTTSAMSGDFTGTDPLTAVGSFGYLPDGFQVARHDSDSGSSPTVIAETKPMVPSSLPGYLNPAQLRLSSSATEPKTSAPKTEVHVQGSPKAYIVHEPGSGSGAPELLSLEWQTASGSWFTLGGYNQVHGAALQAQLIKVADSVTAEDSAVPMPIHIEGMPNGVTLNDASLDNPAVVGQDPSAVQVVLSYTDGKHRYISFSIVVIPVGWKDPQGKQPYSPTPVPSDGGKNACKESEGLRICVLDSHDGIPGEDPLDAVGGAKGLLARITSLGKDRANWTTHVVN